MKQLKFHRYIRYLAMLCFCLTIFFINGIEASAGHCGCINKCGTGCADLSQCVDGCGGHKYAFVSSTYKRGVTHTDCFHYQEYDCDVETYTCSNSWCSSTYTVEANIRNQTIVMTSHFGPTKYTDLKNGKHSETCTACNSVVNSGEACNASGGSGHDAACNRDGAKCSYCGHVNHTHNWVVVGEAYGDCSGSKRFTMCNIAGCGQVQPGSQIDDRKDHDWSTEWIITEPATCTTNEVGYLLHKCANNAAHNYGDPGYAKANTAIGHDWGDASWVKTKDATCTTDEEGYNKYICKNDADHEKKDATTTKPNTALGHNWDDGTWVQESARTCTAYERGHYHYVCKRNSDHVKNGSTINGSAPLEHDFDTVWNRTAYATCTEAEKGYNSHTCKRAASTCGRASGWTYKDDATTKGSALGHSEPSSYSYATNNGVANGERYKNCDRTNKNTNKTCNARLYTDYLVHITGDTNVVTKTADNYVKQDSKTTVEFTSKTGYIIDSYGGAPSYTTNSTGSDTKFSISFTMPGKAVNLKINTRPINYYIKFNSNKPANALHSPTGSMARQKIAYDTTVNLNSNAYSISGWTFKGWNTKADGTGTAYSAGASIKNLKNVDESELVLYAQWKDEEKPKYDIPAGDIPALDGFISYSWKKDSYTISLTVSDAGTGIGSLKLYSLENLTTPVANGSKVTDETYKLDYTVTKEGVTEYKLVATDKSNPTNNVLEVKIRVRVDGTAPTVTGFEEIRNIVGLNILEFAGHPELLRFPIYIDEHNNYTFNGKSDSKLSGIKEFTITIENHDNHLMRIWSTLPAKATSGYVIPLGISEQNVFDHNTEKPQDHTAVIVNVGEDNDLFRGNWSITIRAEDNVGHVISYSSENGIFELTAQIKPKIRLTYELNGSKPILMRGETALLEVHTSGYTDLVEIDFTELINKGFRVYKRAVSDTGGHDDGTYDEAAFEELDAVLTDGKYLSYITAPGSGVKDWNVVYQIVIPRNEYVLDYDEFSIDVMSYKGIGYTVNPDGSITIDPLDEANRINVNDYYAIKNGNLTVVKTLHTNADFMIFGDIVSALRDTLEHSK